MIILVLAVLGLCFGSFVNALVWRMHYQTQPKSKTRKPKSKADMSIVHGRSMCPNCKHGLAAIDLIPVLSWLLLGGKCRYCHKPISWQYPAVELATAGLFVISYLYWPTDIAGWNLVYFGSWLVCLVGFMALVVYDLRWMLLPNKIVFPLYGAAAAAVISQVLALQSFDPLVGALYGIAIGGGIFYVLFQISGGRWIGGGDVKLGFLLGALVGGPAQAFMMLFLASLLGTIAILPLMAGHKVSRQTRVPFGPFLIISAVIVQLFGQKILDWYLASLL